MNSEIQVRPKQASRIPMLLSAFVCPGAGQFIQKRWMAGVVFSAGFLVGFFWLMGVALGIIIDFYRMGLEIAYEPENPNIMAMLPPLAIAGVFYLINLFDVVIAQQRIQHKRHMNRVAEQWKI